MNDREIALALGAGWLINKGWTSAEAAGTRATRFSLQRRYQARLMRARRRSAQGAALVGVVVGGAGLVWVAMSEHRRTAALRAGAVVIDAINPLSSEASDTASTEASDTASTEVSVGKVDADRQASSTLAF